MNHRCKKANKKDTMKILKYIVCCFLFTTSCIAQNEGKPEIIRGNENFELLVKVIDIKTKKQVDDTEVYLYKTIENKLISSEITENGLVTFSIEPTSEYEIRTCNTGYLKGGMSIYECNEGNEVLCTFGATDYAFVAGGGKDKPNAFLKATVAIQPVSVGSIFELANVYYDLDKATLRPRGKEELDELIKIMKRNTSIKIELSSHTDSRASQEYNNDLSKRRALSCLDYLVENGISKDRVTPKGYGESRLLNECSNGVVCSEEKHQKNRRTEIEILNYDPIECMPMMDIDFQNKDLLVDHDDKK